MKPYGIIGAGPSGLALRLMLDEPAEILEASDRVGGHAGSVARDGFVFDLGPHIMFSRNKAVLDFMVGSLGENVHRCRRNNKISFRGRLVKYPFENDLGSLPKEDTFECLLRFIDNPYREQYASPQNLEQWLLKTFGSGICERYLFPYNEKVWNLPVKDLSMSWADRIPVPPLADVIKSAVGYETEGYLHQLYYHYPLRGGYGAISNAWAQGADITYGFPVDRITMIDGGVRVSSGKRTRDYRQVVSTMPVRDLLAALEVDVPRAVVEAADKLIINPMYVVSFGVEGEDKNQFTAIYFPDREFLVNRISFPAVFSPENAPAGHYSIQAEITCRASSDTWRMSDDDIFEHVRAGLVERGLLGADQRIVFRDVTRRKLSYVVYDRDYEANAKVVRDWFLEQRVHLLGRFSRVEYINVDAVVERAVELARRLNGSTASEAEILDAAARRLGAAAKPAIDEP